MRITQTALALAMCGVVAASLWLVGSGMESCCRGLREEFFDADAWIATYGREAEAYGAHLRDGGRRGAVPPRLQSYDPRVMGDVVVFTVVRGGFKDRNQGMCYSPDGRLPPGAPEPEDRAANWYHWAPVRGPWFLWAAEFP
jgi:hypothetical protein